MYSRKDGMRAWVTESNMIEGIHRPPTDEEIDAHVEFLSKPVTIESLQELVSVCAPGHVLRDRRGLNVRVGNHIAPPGGPDIPVQLQEIIDNKKADPYTRHQLYEQLHPFTDGNGRSGRALFLHDLNRLSGTKFETPGISFLHMFYYNSLSHWRKEK